MIDSIIKKFEFYNFIVGIGYTEVVASNFAIRRQIHTKDED